MINKIDFSNPLWSEVNAEDTKENLKKFFENPDTHSDIFYDLTDPLIDSSDCDPALFLAIPHLIDFSISLAFKDAIDLWCCIGICMANAFDNRNIVPIQVIQVYDMALKQAQQLYPQLLVKNKKYLCDEGHYLIAPLFGFSQHRLCKIITENFYAKDIAGESIVCCSKLHENDVIIYSDSLIAPIEKYGKKRSVNPVATISPPEHLAFLTPNPMIPLSESLEDFLNQNCATIPNEAISHIQASIHILKSGIDASLPTKYAFSVMGSLLYWCNMKDFAMRTFHAWDKVQCEICGETFVFANQWGMEDLS